MVVPLLVAVIAFINAGSFPPPICGEKILQLLRITGEKQETPRDVSSVLREERDLWHVFVCDGSWRLLVLGGNLNQKQQTKTIGDFSKCPMSASDGPETVKRLVSSSIVTTGEFVTRDSIHLHPCLPTVA